MNQNVLGIDYGTKRIGVAIARGALAEPLTIVANDESALVELKRLIEQEAITHIIVGLSENRMAEQTQQFIDQLKTLTQVPIEFVDETLSSYEMHLALRQEKMTKKQGPIDHFVAARLLQDWLDFST